MKKILLAGATGYLGRYITAELEKQQYHSKIVMRNTHKIPSNSKYTESVVAEVTKPDSLTGIMNDVDTVISTLGITKQKDGLTYMDVDF